MIYLLDASVLMTAHLQYYAIDRVPEYWDWIEHMAAEGHVKVPLEIFEEVKDGPKGDDLLYKWVQSSVVKKALLLQATLKPELVQHVLETGYGEDLTDDQIEQIGRDPFLIAHGLSLGNCCVVTVETSEPKKQRQNRKVPNVCESLGVKWCEPHTFNRTLGFSTDWKKKFKKA